MTDRGPEPEDTSSDADLPDPLDPAAPDGSEDAGLTPELDGLDEVDGDLDDEVDDGLITDDEDDDLVEAEIVETVSPGEDELSAAGAATVASVGTAKTTVRSRLSEGRTKLEIDDPASKWWVALIVVVFVAIFGWALLFGQGGLLSGVFPAASPTPSPSVLPSTSPSPQASPSPVVSPTALATTSASPTPKADGDTDADATSDGHPDTDATSDGVAEPDASADGDAEPHTGSHAEPDACPHAQPEPERPSVAVPISEPEPTTGDRRPRPVGRLAGAVVGREPDAMR